MTHRWRFSTVVHDTVCINKVALRPAWLVLDLMGNLPWYVTWYVCLQCFDAVGWVAGRTSGVQKTEWWGAGVVIYLEQGADLHVVQLSLASVKSRLVFLFWYWLTWVVLDKGPLNVCVCTLECNQSLRSAQPRQHRN